MSTTGLGAFFTQPANGGLSPVQRAGVKAWSRRQPANGGLSVAQQIGAGNWAQRQPANGGLSPAQQIQAGQSPSKGGMATPKTAPATPPAPAAPGPGGTNPAAPGGQALTATPEVRDSTYWAGIGTNDFTRDTGLADITTKNSRLDEDTTTRLGQLAHNLVLTNDNIAESENKSNLFGSGHMQKLTGEAGYQNQQDVNATNLAHDRGHEDSNTAHDRLISQYGDPGKAGDYGIAGAGLYADSGQRWLTQHPGGTPTGMAYDPKGNLVPQEFDDSVDGGKSLHQQLIDSKGGQAAPKTAAPPAAGAPSHAQPAGGGLSPAQKAQAKAGSKGGMVRPK